MKIVNKQKKKKNFQILIHRNYVWSNQSPSKPRKRKNASALSATLSDPINL